MPKQPVGEKRMTYSTAVRLPDEWADELERLSKERGAPPAVMARMVLIEWLREQKAAREGQPRAQGQG